MVINLSCNDSVPSGICGNNKVDNGEDCDGDTFAVIYSSDCRDLGYSGGIVSCNNCELDLSDCLNHGVCGDGNISPLEECDSGSFAHASSEQAGLYTGELACLDDYCIYDRRYATYCGDGALQTSEGEICDGLSFTMSCSDVGAWGFPTCSNDCQRADFGGCDGIMVFKRSRFESLSFVDFDNEGNLIVAGTTGSSIAGQENGDYFCTLEPFYYFDAQTSCTENHDKNRWNTCFDSWAMKLDNSGRYVESLQSGSQFDDPFVHLLQNTSGDFFLLRGHGFTPYRPEYITNIQYMTFSGSNYSIEQYQSNFEFIKSTEFSIPENSLINGMTLIDNNNLLININDYGYSYFQILNTNTGGYENFTISGFSPYRLYDMKDNRILVSGYFPQKLVIPEPRYSYYIMDPIEKSLTELFKCPEEELLRNIEHSSNGDFNNSFFIQSPVQDYQGNFLFFCREGTSPETSIKNYKVSGEGNIFEINVFDPGFIIYKAAITTSGKTIFAGIDWSKPENELILGDCVENCTYIHLYTNHSDVIEKIHYAFSGSVQLHGLKTNDEDIYIYGTHFVDHKSGKGFVIKVDIN